MSFDFEKYLKLSLEEKYESDLAAWNLPDLSGLANDLVSHPIEIYNKGFYIPQKGYLSLQWSKKKSFEAWIASDGNKEVPFHTIYITEHLLKQLAADAEAFTRYATYRLTEPYFYDIWKRQGIVMDGIGVFPLGVDPHANKHMLLNHGLTWIVTHEIAHSLQSHAAFRYGVPGITWVGQSHVAEKSEGVKSCSALESEIFQVTELAADYQALNGLVMGLISQKRYGFEHGQVKESFITLSDVWTLFTSIALVFLRFHHFDGKKFDGSVEGHHPHPAIRYLMLTQNLIGLLVEGHLKSIGGYNISEEELFQTMVYSFWVAIMFWADRYQKGTEIINFGEILTDPETPEIKSYFTKMVSRWDSLRPIVKKGFDNEFFLMRFNIFVRRITGIPEHG